MASSLYVHIPFCVRKCIYCDFLSIPYDETLARRYTAALCRELELSKAAGELKTIYIGGGTPSLLPGDCCAAIFERIRDRFNLSPSAEISVEMNPGAVKDGAVDLFLSLGVNRLSLGVQSFRDDELKLLGRIHSAGEAIDTIRSLKAAGISNFSVDLLYGIPGQTMAAWEETLSTATGLSPVHVSAYELTPEKGTPLYRSIEAGSVAMPDEEQTAEAYAQTIDFLSASGYEHYEISNYAVSGFRCLHNMNYWDRGEYIGAGAGAHSFIDGVRRGNTGDIGKYIEDLESDRLPCEDSSKTTPAEAAREFLFLGLRKTEGISLAKAAEMGLQIPESCGDLIGDGYVSDNDGFLKLTRKGLIISNTVIVTLFQRLGL